MRRCGDITTMIEFSAFIDSPFSPPATVWLDRQGFTLAAVFHP
jgi:hypothetical protein